MKVEESAIVAAAEEERNESRRADQEGVVDVFGVALGASAGAVAAKEEGSERPRDGCTTPFCDSPRTLWSHDSSCVKGGEGTEESSIIG